MIDIIPGILEKNIIEIERKITLVAPYVDWVQIDVGDNTLFPCDTVRDAAKLAPVIAKFARSGKRFEAHLMVQKPIDYLKPFVELGCSRIIAHVESDDLRDFLADSRTQEVEVGVALDADTPFEQLEPFLEEVDFVLVMTGEAGASCNMFQPETVEKIKTIHRNLPDLPIEVDVGITPETAKIVKDAGATRIVTTSYIFQNELDIAQRIEMLKNA